MSTLPFYSYRFYLYENKCGPLYNIFNLANIQALLTQYQLNHMFIVTMCILLQLNFLVSVPFSLFFLKLYCFSFLRGHLSLILSVFFRIYWCNTDTNGFELEILPFLAIYNFILFFSTVSLQFRQVFLVYHFIFRIV